MRIKKWLVFDPANPPSWEGYYLGYCAGAPKGVTPFYIDIQNKLPYFFDGRFSQRLEGLTHYVPLQYDKPA